MKRVFCTGMTGTQRLAYLGRVKKLADREHLGLTIINVWDEMETVAQSAIGKKIQRATVVNLPKDQRATLMADAFASIAAKLENIEETRTDEVAVVAGHAVVDRGGEQQAFDYRLLSRIEPDMYVTIIDNIKTISEELDRDPDHRFPDLTLMEILKWQRREIEGTCATARCESPQSVQHCLVATGQKPQTLFDLLFLQRKKIYASYPITESPEQDLPAVKKVINELRDRGYIVFDPYCITDLPFARAQTELTPRERRALIREVGAQIVTRDYHLIDQSDLVVVYYPTVKYPAVNEGVDEEYVPLSAGVICEMVRGHSQGKEVYVIWLADHDPSPFFIYHTKEKDVFTSVEQLWTRL